jgi:RimJ/RimL family protein N-acetyltransferase
LSRITLEPVTQDTPPEMLLDTFNSNRDFLEISGERVPYTADNVAMYFYEETQRENARCFLIRLVETGQVVGTAAMAVPHPPAGCPWIGLMLIDARCQSQGIGAEASALIDAMLAGEGWGKVRLGVLKANPRARAFWERQGYGVIGEKEDQDKRPVWLMGKSLPGRLTAP